MEYASEFEENVSKYGSAHPILIIFFYISVLNVSIYMIILTFKFFTNIWKYILHTGKDLKRRYGEGWAVITGASKGIGEAFAWELGRRGFNLILIARSKNLLLSLGSEIERKYPNIRSRSIEFDFGATYTKYEELVGEIGDVDIKLLVNNVGVVYPGSILSQPPDNIYKNIMVNTFAMTYLTEKLFPCGGGILNVSSATSSMPYPYMGFYAPTKAYTSAYTYSLYKLLRHSHPLDILSVQYGPVTTQMNPVKYIPFYIDASTAVRGGLRSLGLYSYTYSCLSHSIIASILRTSSLLRAFTGFAMSNPILIQLFNKLRKYKYQ